MAAPQPPPPLNIPSSPHTVTVSIIDTTAHVRIPASRFFQPTIPGHETLSACCYAFLIQHSNPSNPSKHDTLLFDLGVRKDFHNGPKVLVDMVSSLPDDALEVEKNVADILTENGVSLDSIGGIIWSHHHFDHTGDPSTFPSSTDLIVGPGFKKAFVPAYPTISDAAVDERAWAGRELIEISFPSSISSSASSHDDSPLTIGQYSAHDLYGDGSLYLLNTPGHAIGHMAALARTKAEPPEFMFLGGDIAHHGGEFRPTEYLPLPSDIRPNPLSHIPSSQYAAKQSCPGSLFEALHPNPSKSSAQPFYHLAEGGVHADAAAAQESLDNMHAFDAREDVFVAIAHDRSVYDLYEYFPATANEWRRKGWKEEGRWRFLGDFDVSAKEA